jgi:prepilin-type processing-associated H-X9-DG protein
MLALPKAAEIDQLNFEFQNDFLSATKRGIDHLATVAEAVTSEDSDPDQVKAQLGSPAIFDLSLIVLPKLLPRDAQVSGLVLSGKALRGHEPITVNHASVKKGNTWLAPFESEKEDSFTGFVDRPVAQAGRFNLMFVDGHPNRIIRCRFQKDQQEEVRNVWGKRARIIGKVQYNRQKKPSLVEVTRLETAKP